MFRMTFTGDWKRTERFLRRGSTLTPRFKSILESYGNKGVQALSEATPVDTSLTANSWDYRVEVGLNTINLVWFNTNVVNGVSVAVILQYGHGTGTGGYVEGVDYINPVMKTVFEEIANALWKEVTNL